MALNLADFGRGTNPPRCRVLAVLDDTSLLG